ncbi:hypothetical protein D0Z07_2218 [Hyphodiscus hymeniophilus]|uniref:Uncharacterized protein n=1 Tax=Hyphodiscus hymeniophilus TaxID=353542 RepID=A0A9P6VMA9_9HELO|nr:hypothetical protein D0Z07_2218 [Hyphodiscus hymeniophilus]
MFCYHEILALSLLGRAVTAQQIVNGQIYTPGIAIVDAPQPNTPLGGGESSLVGSSPSLLTVTDFLQVALDVTSDGQLQLPPYPSNSPTEIYNITIFLSSYTTGKNFTISNGTATAGNASLGEIMEQEPSSTVKHVNWVWPDCLVGNGPALSGDNSSRGAYNISIRQNFKLNGTNMYTIFDLPIEVTNEISANDSRPSCNSLNNNLLTQNALNASANNFSRIPGSALDTSNGKGSGSGIGAGSMVEWRTAVHWIWIASFTLMFAL